MNGTGVNRHGTGRPRREPLCNQGLTRFKIKESFAIRTISVGQQGEPCFAAMRIRRSMEPGRVTPNIIAPLRVFDWCNPTISPAFRHSRNMSPSVRVVPPERGDSDVRSESLQG